MKLNWPDLACSFFQAASASVIITDPPLHWGIRLAACMALMLATQIQAWPEVRR